MGCPNRNSDRKILAEIERRKLVTKEPEFEFFSWSGQLFDISGLDIDMDKIVSITRTGDCEWMAQLKV